MTRNPTTLAAIGTALYGPSWRKPLSRDLDVDPRTMRRWENSEFTIPDGIWPELRTLMAKHAAILTWWASKIT